MSDDRNMTSVITILKERSEAEAALHFLVSERREVPTFSHRQKQHLQIGSTEKMPNLEHKIHQQETPLKTNDYRITI